MRKNTKKEEKQERNKNFCFFVQSTCLLSNLIISLKGKKEIKKIENIEVVYCKKMEKSRDIFEN